MNQISSNSCFPVRPIESISPVCIPCMPVRGIDGEDEGWEEVADSHIPAATGSLETNGPEDVVNLDSDEVIQPAIPLPAPIPPSKKEVEIHNLFHLPYRSWCKHCVAARRKNSHHRRCQTTAQRTVPLMVADYAYLRDHIDQELATILVVRLLPSNLVMSIVCDEKGLDDRVTARLAQFIKESGYAHISYRSDQERSIRALFEDAFVKSTRQGELFNPRLQQMVPEASSVGESQSNGKAEIAVQKIEDLVRTYESAIETNAQTRISSTSPTMRWIVEHAASVANRQICNADGRTPFETIHGQRWKGRAVEFGEQVFYFVPKKLRAKLNVRWRVGTYLGNAQATNECYVAASNGDVVKARAVVRIVEPSRWSKAALEGIRGTPMCFRPQQASDSDDHLEESASPQAHDDPADDEDVAIGPEEVVKLDRHLRITLKDLQTYGFTPGCPRCNDLQNGKYNSAKHHTNECRLRVYLAYQEHDHPKWKAETHVHF